MKTLPMRAAHERRGAKFIEFAGWELPVSYDGIIREYTAVRSSLGVFDISHMGKFFLSGHDAASLLQEVLVSDVMKFIPGCAYYSLVCGPSGGILDDVVVYKVGEEAFILIANAASEVKIAAHLAAFARGGADIANLTGSHVLFAVQGPLSADTVGKICPGAACLDFYTFVQSEYRGKKIYVARTGYTGELGWEILADAETGRVIWEEIAPPSVQVCGLGARDMLRAEMGYRLYGTDMDEHTTPFTAGLMWTVSLQKGPFTGREGIIADMESASGEKFIPFVMSGDAGIPRHHYGIYSAAEKIGHVTTGGKSPVLGITFGMGYIRRSYAGEELFIEIRGKKIAASRAKLPFYRQGSVKIKL